MSADLKVYCGLVVLLLQRNKREEGMWSASKETQKLRIDPSMKERLVWLVSSPVHNILASAIRITCRTDSGGVVMVKQGKLMVERGNYHESSSLPVCPRDCGGQLQTTHYGNPKAINKHICP